MKSLSIYRPEDEALLGLLDARESSQPDTLARTEADAAIAAWLGTGTARHRVDTVCSILAGIESQRQGIDTQLMRLRAIKDRIEGHAAILKTRIAQIMSDFGVKRMTGSAETLVLHTNPPAVQFTDEALVPDDYRVVSVTMTAAQWTDIANLLSDTGNDKLLDAITTTTPAIRKSLISTTLKAGGGVPGAFLEQAVTVVRK